MDVATASLRPRLRLVGTCLGLTVGGIVAGSAVLVAMLLVVFALGVDLSGPGLIVVSLVAIQGIGFPAVGYGYLRYTGRSVRAFVPVAVPGPRQIAVIIGGWVAALGVLSVVGATLVTVSGTEPAENSGAQVASQNPEFIPFLLPLVFLLNAPGEEFLFRGVIQGLFRERFGAAGAVVLATLMFAPIHLVSLVGSPQAALVTVGILVAPSLVFGAVYEYTDNFVVPTLVHALYNATLFTGLFLRETGAALTVAS